MTNYEHTRVSRRHPQISIHLGGTIEAYCHCAASCYSATASNGCAASYRRPSAHHSDGFSTAVLPAAALATAVLHISSWLWTYHMTWFNQCHLEALKRPTNLKRWILQNIRGGMALMNYEHTTYCCPAHYCTVCRLLAALFMATAMPPMPGAASARFCVFPPISNSRRRYYCTKASCLWISWLFNTQDCLNFSVAARSSHGLRQVSFTHIKPF